MKKTIPLILVLIAVVATPVFSQKTYLYPAFSKQDYLHKSKKQNTVAFVLLGSGVVLVATSLIGDSNDIIGGFFPADSWVPKVLFSAGAGCMIGSIPFFIISGKNKRKARSLSFGNQKIPFLQKSSFVYHQIPSLKLKISL